jgi:hypothetical protein
MSTELFAGDKRPEPGVYYLPPSSDGMKNVELYLCVPSVPPAAFYSVTFKRKIKIFAEHAMRA